MVSLAGQSSDFPHSLRARSCGPFVHLPEVSRPQVLLRRLDQALLITYLVGQQN